MHKEIEDYVDDIFVKSKTKEDQLAILQRVFKRCRLYKLRMNPLKYAFRVTARKFLGFLIHQRGIDVDPRKVQVIATMKSPTTLTQLKARSSCPHDCLYTTAERRKILPLDFYIPVDIPPVAVTYD